MRIQSDLLIGRVDSEPASESTPPAAGGETSGGDSSVKVKLSAAARKLAESAQQARDAKIAALREAVDKGTLLIHASLIADRILERG